MASGPVHPEGSLYVETVVEIGSVSGMAKLYVCCGSEVSWAYSGGGVMGSKLVAVLGYVLGLDGVRDSGRGRNDFEGFDF